MSIIKTIIWAIVICFIVSAATVIIFMGQSIHMMADIMK